MVSLQYFYNFTVILMTNSNYLKNTWQLFACHNYCLYRLQCKLIVSSTIAQEAKLVRTTLHHRCVVMSQFIFIEPEHLTVGNLYVDQDKWREYTILKPLNNIYRWFSLRSNRPLQQHSLQALFTVVIFAVRTIFY